LIVVVAHSEHPSNTQNFSGISDTIGNTYTRRSQQQYTTSAGKNTVEIWWAISTGSNASNLITASLSTGNCDDAGFVAFIVTGHDATNPWDGNGSLPKTGNTGLFPSANASVTGISTTKADDLIISLVCSDHNAAFTSPLIGGSSATLINSWSNNAGSNWSYGDVAALSVSSTQSSITAGWTNSSDKWGLTVDAITADSSSTGVTGTWASTGSADTMSASGASGLNGTWASTEAQDGYAGTVYVPPTGTWSSTEAKDTFLASGSGTISLHGTQRLEIEDAVVVNGSTSFNLTSGGFDRVLMLVVNNVVAAGADPSVIKPITAITGSGTVGSTLTWRCQDIMLGGPDEAGDVTRTEVWWAFSHLPVVNEPFSYTFGSGTSASLVQAVGFTIKGLNGNYAQPFSDTNPYSSGGNSGAMATGITSDGIENSFGVNSVSSTTQTIAFGGTSLTKRALVLATFAFVSTTSTPNSVTSVTDNNGNTWARYTTQSAGSGWNLTNTHLGAQKGFTTEVWYTNNATVGTSLNITVTLDGTIDAMVGSISPKFLGCDIVNPFDTNGSLPDVLRIHAGSAAQTLTGVSTSSANETYPVWCMGMWGTALNHQNVTFNGVNRQFQSGQQQNNGEFVLGQFASGPINDAGPYSNVTYSSPTSSDNTYIIGFALVAQNPLVSQPKLTRPVATGALSSSGGSGTHLIFDSSKDNNVTLSGGGLIVTSSGTNDPHNWTTALDNGGKTTGTIYYEVKFNHIAGAEYGTGLLYPGHTPDGLIQSGQGGIFVRGDGSIWAAGAQVGILGTAPVDNDVIGIALNFDTGEAWFRNVTQGLTYNGHSGLPQFDIGGLSMSTFSLAALTGHQPLSSGNGGKIVWPTPGAVLPYASPGGTTTSAIQTYNFGATSFAGSPPAGFQAGWLTTEPAVTPTRVDYHSIVIGWATSVVAGSTVNDISTPPPGYTLVKESTSTGGGLASALTVYAQVRAQNILTTDNDLMPFPVSVKHWTLGYDELVVGTADPGSWESTEATDSFHGVGYVGAAGIRGDLLSTEAKDTFAAAGSTPIVAVWTSTEAKDQFSAFIRVPVTGSWNSTEARDIALIHATTPGTGGPWASTEAPDVLAAIGNTPISGVFVASENPDRFFALGSGVVRVRPRRTFYVT
jgi:hypothetical protein